MKKKKGVRREGGGKLSCARPNCARLCFSLAAVPSGAGRVDNFDRKKKSLRLFVLTNDYSRGARISSGTRGDVKRIDTSDSEIEKEAG